MIGVKFLLLSCVIVKLAIQSCSILINLRFQEAQPSTNPFLSYQNSIPGTFASDPQAAALINNNENANKPDKAPMIHSINVLTASATSIEVSIMQCFVLNSPIQGCATELRTDLENGLPTAEANQRLQFSGYNEFEMAVRESLLRKYIEQVNFKSIFQTYFHRFSSKIL
jgi:hypothetical protein